MTLLNLWRHLKKEQKERSSSAFRRMCKAEFLNYLRVREWQDFESQLRQVCKEMKLEIGHPADSPDADGIHQRSEEHTSELQSLMRSSYAVFCLKKTNKH